MIAEGAGSRNLGIYIFPWRFYPQANSSPESALGPVIRAALPLVVALGAVRVAVAQPLLGDAVPAAPTAVRAPIHAGAVLLVRPVAAVREPVANATPGDATPSGGGDTGSIRRFLN